MTRKRSTKQSKNAGCLGAIFDLLGALLKALAVIVVGFFQLLASIAKWLNQQKINLPIGKGYQTSALVVVVLVCLLLSCGTIIYTWTDSQLHAVGILPTYTPTISPTFTPTLTPTATAIPTPTQRPTLVPTPTSEPSRTPKPTPTSDIPPTNTPTPGPTTVQLCKQVEVKNIVGSGEPEYVGLTGYLKARLDPRYYDERIPSTPWQVPTLRQSGPNNWEETGESLPAKTPVLVLNQFLEHEGFGRYDGVLIVQSLEDKQEYIIDVYYFTTTDYWNCPPHIAIKYSPFIARVIQEDVKPINRRGEWGEMGSQKEVLCIQVADHQIDDTVENGVNCLLYKQYVNGFGGVEHTFPSKSLEIVY